MFCRGEKKFNIFLYSVNKHESFDLENLGFISFYFITFLQKTNI